jgi:hypothetical protein
LFDAHFLRRRESVESDALPISLSAVPPFEEVTPLNMDLVTPVDNDMVMSDSAFAVKEGGSGYPFVVAFYLFEGEGV